MAGFSLVEVMCALAIAAMALVVLFRGLGGSQSAANSLEAHLAARIIAQSILEDELHASETARAERAGDSGPYQWRLVIEPASVPETGTLPKPFQIYRLTVDITWAPRGRFTLDTLKLGK
jgi:prepilin-type N-terminal cleavage/methylation domain-containing protein